MAEKWTVTEYLRQKAADWYRLAEEDDRRLSNLNEQVDDAKKSRRRNCANAQKMLNAAVMLDENNWEQSAPAKS